MRKIRIRRLVLIFTGIWVFTSQVLNVYFAILVAVSSDHEESQDSSAFHRREQATLRGQPSKVHVFYHSYINPDEISIGLEIFDEQIKDIAELLAGSQDVHVHYTTVGSSNATKRQCPDNIRCVHLGHHDSGYEYLTLEALHEFCHSNPDEMALYLHSKGSFHSSDLDENYHGPNQKVWRQQMLRAISSQECRNAIGNGQCDACGLLFMTPWAPLFPGNFFAASCDYINKLVKPNLELGTIFSDIQEEGSVLGLQFTLYDPEPWNTGADRFAFEQWIGTHPSLRPCDMAELPHLLDVTHGIYNGVYEQKFSTAPHFPLDSDWYTRPDTLSDLLTPESTNQRRKEYFLLPGLLLKYYTLYRKYPDSESWVWKWYPDGAFWRNAALSSARSFSFKEVLEATIQIE